MYLVTPAELAEWMEVVYSRRRAQRFASCPKTDPLSAMRSERDIPAAWALTDARLHRLAQDLAFRPAQLNSPALVSAVGA